MRESNKPQRTTEDVIAAFDREREAARELSRRYLEQTRAARVHDRPVYIERRRKPR